jgi:diguanylate cyclase (GGDEF)-like protein
MAMAATLAVAACAAAAVHHGAAVVGDVAVAVAELAAACLVWVVGSRRKDSATGWRLLAVALFIPVAWALVALGTAGSDAVGSAYFSWAPTIPAYLLAIAASLTFLERSQLRSGGPRVAVELVLFTTACLLGFQLVVLGPEDGWGGLDIDLRLTLGAAVLTMSASMAVGLTVLGVIEARRQRMALCLLAGSVLMSLGQGLGASPALAGVAAAVDASRFLVVAGMAALSAAVLVDPGPSADAAERRRPPTGSWTRFRQTAPHVAMVVATLVVVGVTLADHHPDGTVLAGVVCCVALAAVHRWLTAREEERVTGLLQRSEAYFRSLVRSSSDGVLILDDELRISWASPALDRTLGDAATGLTGRSLIDVVHPDDTAAVAAALSTATLSTATATATTPTAPVMGDADGPEPDRFGGGLLLFRLQDADGVWRYLEAGVSDVRRDADVGALVLHCRDMTERHDREQALQSVAYIDPMTGLPNRAGFEQTLDERLSGTGTTPAALLVIELNGLVAARERAGREVISAAVAEIGRRLRTTVRGDDIVARMGGGAFAVLAGAVGSELDQLAARCHAVVEQPLLTTAGVIDLSAWVGLAETEPAVGVETLLHQAELAVRAARASGPGSTARYGATIAEAADRRERLGNDLVGACARDEFSLLLQPVVSFEEQRIAGVEVLVRWRHPTLGEVAPEEFLPIAESAGLIAPLQAWVFEAAMTAAVALPSSGAPLRMGINLPAGYLATGMLVADVEAALVRSGLGPERLILEIGEDAVLSADDRVGLDLATLRLMGVHLALDSFGAGQSALAHLTQLPFDVLKLDRSLISRLDRDHRSRAFCESIVGIGRALGLDVVADGVETSAQLAALEGFGCGFAQGFLISRPLPVAGFTAAFSDGSGVFWPGLVSCR